MSSYIESSFHDDYGVQIFTYKWAPEGKAVGAFQIAHGIGEHARRYDEFARFLADNGFVVYANDHRGHGQTGVTQYAGNLHNLGRLGPGGLLGTEAAISNFTEIIRGENRGLPLVYFGHSWGSLMGQRIINTKITEYDAVILSGSAYRSFAHMESGDLNRHHKHLGTTGFEWLSRDEAVAKAFAADPLCFNAQTLKLLGVRDSMRLLGKPAKHLADRPMLILGGTDDPLSKGDSLERLAAAYRNSGLSDVTLKLYMGGRHEMLNEINRAEVYEDILGWAKAKLSK